MYVTALSRASFLVPLVPLLALAACDRQPAAAPPARTDANQSATAASGHDHPDDHDHHDDHHDEIVLTQNAIDRLHVQIDTASARVLRPIVRVPATVAFNAEATAHVGSPLHGRIAAIPARLGASIKAGDTLLVINSPDLGESQADLLLKRSAAEAAAPPVELARLLWDRTRQLYEKSQAIALSEVQQREAEFKIASAQQRLAQAAATAAENRLLAQGMPRARIDALINTGTIDPTLAIVSPIDATVVQREATLGELVGPDRDALLVLADTRSVWILAEVPEARLIEIALGAAAKIVLQTPAVPSAATPSPEPRRLEGTVSYLSPLVNPATRTAQVRIELAGSNLAPGMFVETEIELAAASIAPVVAVPESAIQTIDGNPAIFVPVVDEPNTFAPRAVTLGSPVGGLVPVLSGLSEGDRFVTKGSFILKAELGKSGAAHQH